MVFSTHDNVTGLPYFDEFIRASEEELSNHWQEWSYALVSMDINNFKYINRIYGVETANQLLCNGIDLILATGDAIVIACRTHSDHLVLLYRYNGSREEVREKLEAVAREFVHRYARHFPSVSLHLNNGIYFLENEKENFNFALDKANAARRIAKGNYSVDSVVFQPEMLLRQDEDVKILAMFEDALKNDRIQIYYQPKMNVLSQNICGAEALSRIFDRDNNPIFPDSYIPVLENSGKIVQLDWYVIRKVFESMENWLAKGYSVPPVSINLSRMHFYESDMAERIIHEFELYKIPVRYVEFELTESVFFSEANRITTEIKKLRNYGFKVSMDDFGTGYSTLSELASLPVDVIKFDKSFVHSSMEKEAGFLILQSLVNVFKRINYEVICEGVETREEERRIFECGCDCVQGFLYDRPLPQNVFVEKYLQKIRR